MKSTLITFLFFCVCAFPLFSQTSTIEGLTDATTIAAGDKVWMVDVSATGVARDVDATLEQVVSPFAADPSSNASFDAVEWAADLNITSAWGDVTGTPTTLSGYGIADAYTVTAADAAFATAAQGALADSATQPGSDVSTLFNDIGFIDGSSLDGSAVDSGVVAEDRIDPLITRDAELTSAINNQSFQSGVRFAASGSAEFAPGMCDFGLNDFSLVAQMRLDDYTPATAGELVATHASGDSRLSVTIEPDGDWRFSFTDALSAVTSYDLTPSTALLDGTAYLIVLAVDRAGVATLYVDATSRGTVDLSAESAVDLGAANATQGTLFADANLSGVVGELLVCNHALTPTDAVDISQSGAILWVGLNPELLLAGAAGPTSSVYSKLSGTGTISSGTISSFDVDAGASWIATNHLGSFKILAGQTVRASITVTGDFDGGSVVLVSGSDLSDYVALSAGTQNYLITAPVELLYGDIRFTGLSSADGMSISVNSIDFLGVTAALPNDEGIGYQLHDVALNAYDLLLSASGTSHLRPALSGYVRDFAVDAYNGGAGNQELVSSTRNILPASAIIDGAVVKNTTGTITAGLLDLKRSSRSAYNTVGDNGAGLSGGQLMKVTITEGAQTASYLNVALDGVGDADATSLDIRVNYSLIK